MLTFEQIEELVATRKPLPKYADVTERCAYHEISVAEDLYKRCLILKQERDKMRADAWHTFHDLRRTSQRLNAAYKQHLEGIKKAETTLSELIKRTKSGEDAETLLADAFEVISLLEGQVTNSYAHIFKIRAEKTVTEVA